MKLLNAIEKKHSNQHYLPDGVDSASLVAGVAVVVAAAIAALAWTAAAAAVDAS